MWRTFPRPLRRRIATVIFLLASLSIVANAQHQSGCQLCSATGQCDHAYHNGPGKYCGDWFDVVSTKPCCCPNVYQNSPVQCVVSYNACMCHVEAGSAPSGGSASHGGEGGHGGGGSGYGGGGGAPHNYDGADYGVTVTEVVVPVVIICFLLCLCFALCAKRPDDDAEHDPVVAVATPVTAVPVGNPPPTAPGWDGGYYGSVGDHRTKDGGGAPWGAALGGLAAGTLIGNFMAQRREGDGGSGGGGGGGFWGGGGGSGGGGGDFGGGGGGGYDIEGDSGGGGGFDIGGDSGGGGGFDISGDS